MSYDDDEIGDDEHEVGTILRPLHWTEQGYHPDWERRPGHTPRRNWDPTIRWGDETFITIPALASTADVFTQDLLNSEFNKTHGQTTRLWFHGEVLEVSGSSPRVNACQLELVIGAGSQTTTIRKAYQFLPQLNVPLDVSWDVPIQNIRGRVSARGNGVKIRFSLWLVPLVGGKDAL